MSNEDRDTGAGAGQALTALGILAGLTPSETDHYMRKQMEEIAKGPDRDKERGGADER